jgi:ribosomal protein S27E
VSAATRARRARAPPFLDPPGYARHRPEATLLYQLVGRHYPAFREMRAEAGRSLPDYIEKEFDAYLKCGRLEEGFLRLRCEDCHAEKLVAFSCKKRGFCPSCGARRMAETAALLADEVLPERPLRQWVLSLPHALRFLLATNPDVLTVVLGVVHRAISGHLLKHAGLTRATGHTGAVTLIQRFGSALNVNIHCHMLFKAAAAASSSLPPAASATPTAKGGLASKPIESISRLGRGVQLHGQKEYQHALQQLLVSAQSDPDGPLICVGFVGV